MSEVDFDEFLRRSSAGGMHRVFACAAGARVVAKSEHNMPYSIRTEYAVQSIPFRVCRTASSSGGERSGQLPDLYVGGTILMP